MLGSRRPQGSLHLQLYIRRIEDLLERAPPTTAYNKTALLAQYQEALTGSERPPDLYQPPVSAPEQAYLAKLRGTPGGIAVAIAPTVDQGLKGGDTIVRAPASAEVKCPTYTFHHHSKNARVCRVALCIAAEEAGRALMRTGLCIPSMHPLEDFPFAPGSTGVCE